VIDRCQDGEGAGTPSAMGLPLNIDEDQVLGLAEHLDSGGGSRIQISAADENLR
jgi:hypothetical protein